MNMPDFEDASPPHFQPDGTPTDQPLGIFAAIENAKEIFEGRWADRSYEVVKKGQKRAYKINKSPAQWPTRFGRPPGIHVRYDHIRVDGEPVPGLIPIVVLWTLNNYDSLKRAGTGVYYYIPKIQTPQEALVVEKLLARLEALIGVPAGAPSRSRSSMRKAMRAGSCRRSPGPCGAGCLVRTSGAGTTWRALLKCGRTTRGASFQIRSRSAWPPRA